MFSVVTPLASPISFCGPAMFLISSIFSILAATPVAIPLVVRTSVSGRAIPNFLFQSYYLFLVFESNSSES